jgi:hypothetical protein
MCPYILRKDSIQSMCKHYDKVSLCSLLFTAWHTSCDSRLSGYRSLCFLSGQDSGMLFNLTELTCWCTGLVWTPRTFRV